MRWATRNRFAPLASVAVALAAALLWIGMYFGDAFDVLELDTIDARFEVRPDRGADDVAVVAVDDVTFDELDRRWPFPRTLHADVIDRLDGAGAALIAYDVQFSEQSDDRDEDDALIEAIARTEGKVVLAATEFEEQTGAPFVLGGDPAFLRELDTRAGFASFDADPGGIERRVSHRLDGLSRRSRSLRPSSFATAPITREDMGGNDAWIDFAGPAGTVTSVSFSDVLQGDVPSATFRDKVVVVGRGGTDAARRPHLLLAARRRHVRARAAGQRNHHGAEGLPTARRPGLARRPARRSAGNGRAAGRAAPAALARGCCIGGLAGRLPRRRPGRIRRRHGDPAVVHPALALVLGVIGTLSVQAITSAFERQRVRDLFARFVPEAVVDDVIAQCRRCTARRRRARRHGALRRPARLHELLRGPSATAVLEVLNRFLGDMTDTILDNGGTLSRTSATGSWPCSAVRSRRTTTPTARSPRRGS